MTKLKRDTIDYLTLLYNCSGSRFDRSRIQVWLYRLVGKGIGFQGLFR